MKKYDIIYADPPWTYRDKASAGKRGVVYKYPLLTTQELIDLPVHKIAEDNSVLFLWATFPLLNEAMQVIKAWGFDYKTVAFVWIKKNKKANTNFFGMGNWTRANAEIVMLGRRGKIQRKNASISQIVECPIQKPHSRKPSIVRRKIEELMDDGLSKIELFATEKIDGWDSTGIVVDGQDIRKFLK